MGVIGGTSDLRVVKSGFSQPLCFEHLGRRFGFQKALASTLHQGGERLMVHRQRNRVAHTRPLSMLRINAAELMRTRRVLRPLSVLFGGTISRIDAQNLNHSPRI